MKYLSLITFILLMGLLSACGSSYQQSSQSIIGPKSFTVSFNGTSWSQTAGDSVCNVDSSGGTFVVITLCHPTTYQIFIMTYGRPTNWLDFSASFFSYTETQVTFIPILNGPRVNPNSTMFTGASVQFNEQ